VARVLTVAQSVRELAGGLDRFELDVPTLGALVDALERAHPGLGEHVRQSMAVAIDGELHHHAWDAALRADTEVVLIPLIAGG
jgi:molybdopterin converting factor small subunit